ncbi:TolB family protein [Candidatus Riflebacteria bacterium]
MPGNIVFSSLRDGNEDIFTMDLLGNNLIRWTHSKGEGKFCRTPEWSNDRNHIAFQSNRDGCNELYILSFADGMLKRLTNTPGNGISQHPSWSPDNNKIIFSSNRGNGPQLYTIGTDGTDERLIKPDGLNMKEYLNPCWTPDGEKIAFITGMKTSLGGGELWVMNRDGSKPRRISRDDLQIYEYDYSPDGKNIVFDVRHESDSVVGEWDIYIMKSDGSSTQRLTTQPTVNSRPKWLPDGKTIVFHTNRYGSHLAQPAADAALTEWLGWWAQFEICTMHADGSKVKRLTSNHFRDVHPDG